MLIKEKAILLSIYLGYNLSKKSSNKTKKISEKKKIKKIKANNYKIILLAIH